MSKTKVIVNVRMYNYSINLCIFVLSLSRLLLPSVNTLLFF